MPMLTKAEIAERVLFLVLLLALIVILLDVFFWRAG
jgi:hypothetical protein